MSDGSCYMSDADGTSFLHDASGVATKVELRDSQGLVARLEFHPYDEQFYVYGTRNDGDSIYGLLCDLDVKCWKSS